MKTEQNGQFCDEKDSVHCRFSDRVRSSEGERSLHTRNVVGSIPTAPTRKKQTVLICPKPYRAKNGTSSATAYIDGQRVRLTIPREHDLRLVNEMVASVSGYTTSEIVTPAVRAILQHRLCSAKSRKYRNNIHCNLTIDDLEQMYGDLKGRCSVSNVPFDITNTDDKKWRRPFRPSIDRIDSSGHYTRDNSRLVCSLVNFAMGAWGEGAMIFMIAHFRSGR
jgi:hypothetical protein